MLDTIESYIRTPPIPFQTLFYRYVCNMQDKLILQEVYSATRDVAVIDQLINCVIEEMQIQ